jgi:hypothetical protein
MQQLMGSEFVIAPKPGEEGEEGKPAPFWVLQRKVLPGPKPGLERVTWEAVSGPFPRSNLGRQLAVEWMVENEAKGLKPPERALLDELWERAGGGSADPYQMLFIVTYIKRGWRRARLLKYAAPLPPRIRRSGVAA